MFERQNPSVRLTTAQALQLRQAAERLTRGFSGIVHAETIERFKNDLLEKLHASARLPNRLPVLAERFAGEPLRALARFEAGAAVTTPAVLFLCVHDAGRSQIAPGWLRHLAVDGVEVFSGGSEPAESVNRGAVEAMAEDGIDITSHLPMPWDDEIVRTADVVVTMGCDDSCTLFPGKRYLDWELDDPLGKPVAQIRRIRDEIGHRVRGLMAESGVEPPQ